jgi:hypothetical protein
MSGMFGGATNSPTPEVYAGMQVSTSIMGQVKPYITGRTRVGSNLTWYGNFQKHGTGGSNKGGGGAPTSNTYSAAFIAELTLGPITGVFQVFHDRSLVTLTYENLALALGGATFQGSISGTALTVHGQLAGAIEVGGTLSGAGIPQGVTIVSGSGTSWVISTSLGTIATEFMYVTQPVWTGYPAGTPAGQLLSYSGTSYVASSNYNFGSSASMPNLTFETEAGGIVAGYSDAHSLFDASCDNIITDYLTNPITGAGFLGTINTALLTGSTNTFQAYCMAQGIMLSLYENNQRAATDCMKEIMQITNSDFVLSCGVLKIIPYADTAVSGTTADGANWSYTPNLTPLFSFGDGDYCPRTDADGAPTEEPVTLTVKATRDTYNMVNVEYLDRSNYYNPSPAFAQDNNDIAQRGPRCMPTVTLHEITNAVTAKLVAGLILNWQLYERNTYMFRVRYDYWQLEPMDYIAISDKGLQLTNQVCRITEVAESEDNYLTITCMEVPGTVRSTPQYNWSGSQGYVANFDADPGNVQAPAIFAMPPIAAAMSAGLTLGIAVCGPTIATAWGGCYVFASVDGGTTYDYAGTIGDNGPARYGTLTASLGAVPDPDTSSTLSVLLANTTEQLSTSVTHADADAAQTLIMVGSGATVEVMSYGTGSLVSAGAYNLSYLRRGLYQTQPHAQISGAQFVRLDNSIFQVAVDSGMSGQTINFKFCSFNTVGRNVQSLASVTAYPYVIPSNFGGSAIFNSTWLSAGAAVMQSPTSAFKQTTSASGWDSSIYSAQSFTNGCSVQWYSSYPSSSTTPNRVFVGLTLNPAANLTGPNNYTNLNFSMEVDETVPGVQIYESGTLIGTFATSYTTSTLLQILYDGKHVQYYIAGVLVRSVPIADHTFFVQACFFDPGAAIYGLSFSSSTQVATPFTLVPMSINTAAAGTGIRSNNLGSNGFGTKNFKSAESYNNGAQLAFQVNPLSDAQFIGFSTAPATGDTTGLLYTLAGWYPHGASSTCHILFNGANLGNFGAYATLADVFSITYDNFTFRWWRNGTLVHQEYFPSAGPLFLFGDFFEVNEGFANISFSPYGLQSPNPFVASGNAVTHDSTATKLGGSNGWDSALVSINAYKQCHVQGKLSSVAAASNDVFIGLTTNPQGLAALTSNNYVDINYGWHLDGSSTTWEIWESGTLIAGAGAAAVTDLVAITYDGATITYLLNGAVIRTVSVASLLLFAGVAFFYPNSAGVSSLSFGPGTTLDVIDTPEIRANGVSQMGSNFSATLVQNVTGPSGTVVDTTIITLTVTTTGFPVAVDAMTNGSWGTSSGPINPAIALLSVYRDGTILPSSQYDGTQYVAGRAQSPNIPVTLSITDSPAAGSHTYELHYQGKSTGVTGTITADFVNNFIKVREIKK